MMADDWLFLLILVASCLMAFGVLVASLGVD